MNSKLLFFALLVFNFFFSQNKDFFYEYRLVPDSTQKDQTEKEIMVLSVEKERSEFYSQERYRSDSTLLSESQKGHFPMPPNKKMIDDRILKYPDSPSLEHITILSMMKYVVSEEVKLHWELISEFKTLLNYKVQKAVTSYGGRKWTAWFTKDIPIQDGPYKFSGLPGLILELEDASHSHHFVLQGIKDRTGKFIYPELNNFKKVKITYPQYVKLYKSYRKSPVADLVGKIPDYQETNGKMISGQQKVREIEKMKLEEFKKDNNILEIQLLK